MWKSRGRRPEFRARLAQSSAFVDIADRVHPGPAGEDVPPKAVLGECTGRCLIGALVPSGSGTVIRGVL